MPYYWVTPFFYAYGGGGETNTAPWTVDLNIPPSSVYALSSLNYYGARGSSAAIAGFVSYVTQDPDTGVPLEHVTSRNGGNIYNGLGWLAPAFLDENVILITLAWNCYADDWVEAMGSFSVFIGLE
jgi:hypothetical protein